MRLEKAFEKAVEQIVLPGQRNLPPGVAVAIVLYVWHAVRNNAVPSDGVKLRWVENATDPATAMRKALYERTIELVRDGCDDAPDIIEGSSLS